MTRGLKTLTLALALAAAYPASAAAQDPAPEGFAIGAAAGLISFSDEIEEYNAGWGVEGNLRYSFPSSFQVVAGAGYGAVSVENTDEDRTVWTAFVDPRLLLNSGPGVAPFIGARVAYAQWSLDTALGELSASGWNFVAEVGVLVPIAAQLSLEGMLAFGYATFGDIEQDGTTIPDSEDSGTTGSLKAGLVYTFSR